MVSKEFVIVGTLGRPRGVHGEQHVTSASDFPQRFVGLKEIYVRDRDGWTLRQLASVRLIAGRPVVRFEDVSSPEDAARLTNRDLAVLKSDVFELPPDTYYIFDLIGCDVVESETGKRIGRIIDVEQFPANDVYVIEDDAGARRSCPVVRRFVKQVDIAAKKIEIAADGLLDET